MARETNESPRGDVPIGPSAIYIKNRVYPPIHIHKYAARNKLFLSESIPIRVYVYTDHENFVITLASAI